jgi:hypothetical protein
MTTQVPEFGGCQWPMDPACFTDEWEALEPAVKERALSLASATLRRLTGNRVGGCPVTVRPCKPSQCRGYGMYLSVYGRPGFYPYLDAGRWVNSCGHHNCECTYVCSVGLPGPVGRVDQVKVDGDIIDPSRYRVEGARLVAILEPGEDCWMPAVQSLNLPDSEPGTFSVTYLNAYPVDSLGAYAAGVLANEYAKACSGKKCRLPSNVTNVTRQGVAMEMVTGAFPNGQTGIREVDSFITLWNPGGLRQGASVWFPGMSGAQR